MSDSDPATEIETLRQELLRLRHDHGRRIAAIESRLEQISGTAAPLPTPVQSPPAQSAPTPTPLPTPATAQPAPTAAMAQPAVDGALGNNSGPLGEDREPGSADTPTPPPSYLDRSDTRVALAAAELMGMLTGPFASILAFLDEYRAAGKLPALLMSLAGGIALVLGSGFLLQYSFSNLLSEWARVALVGVISLSVTAAGAWISLRRDAMAEYGASVIAIGLSLGYITVYFAGSWYGLVDEVATMGGIFAITALAWGLAVRFETRVTAVLTVFGGAFAPLAIAFGAPDPDMYAGLLVVLAIAGTHLALRINWRNLVTATFVLTTAPFGFAVVSNGDASLIIVLLAAHLLFYCFAWALLFDGLAIRSDATSSETATIVANLMAFTGTVYVVGTTQPTSPGDLSGITTATLILTVNVLPFALITISGLGRGSRLAPVFLLTAGVLVAAAFFSALSDAWLSTAAGIEGLVLIYLGFRLGFRSARLEGILLLAATLAASVWHVGVWVLFDGSGWVDTLVALPAALLLMLAAIWLYSRESTQGIERQLLIVLKESTSLTFAACFLLLTWIFAGSWALALAVIPMYTLLFVASRQGLRFTESLAASHAILLVIAIVDGILTSGSTRMTLQPLPALVARVELFASLWAWSWFYTRYYRDGILYRVTQVLRECFFLALPLVLLPTAWRRFPEWFPAILWGATILSWEIQRRVALRFIRAEHLLLAFATSVTALAAGLAQYEGADVHGYAAVMIGIFYLVALFVREDGLKDSYNRQLEPLFAGAAWYLGACVFGICFYLFGLTAGFALATLLFWYMLVRKPLLRPLRGRLRIIFYPAFVLGMAGATIAVSLPRQTGFIELVLLIVATGAIALLRYSGHRHLRTARRGTPPAMLDVSLHLTVALAYCAVIGWTGLNVSGPATSVMLVAHATVVLFLTLRPQFRQVLWVSITLFAVSAIKIVAYDMSDFSTVEKIIGFMVIGALLIGAAFGYQSVRNRSAVLAEGT